jgi:glycosyltransferase involved in cell wall biosynthesis
MLAYFHPKRSHVRVLGDTGGANEDSSAAGDSEDGIVARPKVLVFGPFRPPEEACGVSAAVRAFAGSSVRDRYDLELVSTYRPARKRGLLRRIAFGAWLGARTAVRTMHSAAVLADIHAVSDRSLLSHAAVMFGARLAGRPALLRIHGGDFDRVFERANGMHRAIIRLILRSATSVIVLSEGWRSRIGAIEPRAIVDVIPNSVDCKVFTALSKRPARDCRRVLFLANFCERKGHFDALKAIARLVPRFPDLVLALGGEDRDPGTRKLMERDAERLGILDRIEFLGTVSGESKMRAFHDADALILPSHTENMPISIMEGMAAGLPVVATVVGAVGEMIEDGETGLLINARDPKALAERLEGLFLDAEYARRLGRCGQAHACATWDADVVAKRDLAIYERIAPGLKASP